jgi:flagellar biosynthesis protein FlhA
MQNLLKERVSVRDIQTILETLADYGTMTKDTDLLTEYVRMSLSRQISQTYQTQDMTIEALALNADIEEVITKSIQETPQGSFMTIDPGVAQQIVVNIKEGLEELMAKGHQPVVLASHQTRRFIRKLLERNFPTVGVLSHGEIATTVRVDTLKVVRL